jgi:hypothetical protein
VEVISYPHGCSPVHRGRETPEAPRSQVREEAQLVFGEHIRATSLELFGDKAASFSAAFSPLSFVRPITEHFAPQLPALKRLSSV